MKTTLIICLVLTILIFSINHANALIYDYRYQGYSLTTIHNSGNDVLPILTPDAAVSFSIQLSQPLPTDPSAFDPSTLILLTAWDGTHMISTANGASYSLSIGIDPTTSLPLPLNGTWRVEASQNFGDGINHNITTAAAGNYSDSPGQYGFDEVSYFLNDGLYHPWDNNCAWNNDLAGTWSLSIINPTPTPEPCTFLLFGAGLGGMFYMRKKRKC